MMLLVASIFCVCSCSKDEEEERLYIPSRRELKVGETLLLGHRCDWASTNTYSATVTWDGTVKAIRQGEANIYSASKGVSCKVIVSPSYTLYKEPLMLWGVSKVSVMSYKGTPYNETSTMITYKTGNANAPYEMYMFDKDVLSSSAVLVKYSYASALVEHLSQRYLPISIDLENSRCYFIDAETVDKAKNVIGVDYYNYSYLLVAYAEKSGTKGLSYNIDFVKDVMSHLEDIQLP